MEIFAVSPPLYTIQSPLPTEPHSVPELLQSTEEPGSGDLMPDMHADELNAIVEELDEGQKTLNKSKT